MWSSGAIGRQRHHPLEPGVPLLPNTLIVSNIFLIIVAVSVGVQILLQFLVRRTKMGKAMRATSFDKPTARLMGINVDGVISFTFALGAALLAWAVCFTPSRIHRFGLSWASCPA